MKNITHWVSTAAIASVMLLILFTSLTTTAAGIIDVTGNTSTGLNEPGWFFNRETTGQYAFTAGTASLGLGSIHVGPLVTGEVFTAEFFPGLGVLPVSSLSSFAYDYKFENTSVTQNQLLLSFATTLDATDTEYDCLYVYEPEVVTTSSFKKAVVFAGQAPTTVIKEGSRIDNCPTTLDAMPEGSHIRAIALTAAADSSGNAFGVYLDNVEVALFGDATTYNFEAIPQTKEDCADDLWKLYNFRNHGQCIKSLNQ